MSVAFGKLADIRERSRHLIETNRDIYRTVAERNGWAVPMFGTVAFPKVVEGCADRLCEVLRNEHETTVVPGSFFDMPSHIRISLVTEPEVLREGLARLELVQHALGMLA